MYVRVNPRDIGEETYFPSVLKNCWHQHFLFDGDGDGDGDVGVAQLGGHAPNDRLTETYSLGLPRPSLIFLEIHVMINCHLSKQDIR